MNDLKPFGKLVSTHNFDGTLVWIHPSAKKSSLLKLKHIFFEKENQTFVPYFIQNIKSLNTEKSFVLLEDFKTKEDAQQVVKKTIWLEPSTLKLLEKKTLQENWLDYTLIDGEKELGKIETIYEQKHQWIASIFIDKKEVLIPLHEENIIDINNKSKKIFVRLPEDLLKIYLEE